MTAIIGYLLALISSLFFSFYVIPRKFSRQSPFYFSLFMASGFFASSLALFFLQPVLNFYEVPNAALWWSVVAGVFWAAGFVAFVKSIDLLGLTRSNQWKNLQGPIGVILSLILLAEFTAANPFLVCLAAFAVFLSAVLFTISEPGEEKKMSRGAVYLALFSALAFGAVAVMNKYVTINVGVYLQQVVWSFSIFLSLLVYIIFHEELLKNLNKVSKKEVAIGLCAGVLYLGASFFMLQSFRFIPASVGFTIVQLNSIWTVLIGLFVFREIDFRSHYPRILLGLLFSILGIALLVFAAGFQ